MLNGESTFRSGQPLPAVDEYETPRLLRRESRNSSGQSNSCLGHSHRYRRHGSFPETSGHRNDILQQRRCRNVAAFQQVVPSENQSVKEEINLIEPSVRFGLADVDGQEGKLRLLHRTYATNWWPSTFTEHSASTSKIEISCLH